MEAALRVVCGATVCMFSQMKCGAEGRRSFPEPFYLYNCEALDLTEFMQ